MCRLHQGLGESDDFLTNETERLRAELAQTDDELRRLKMPAGVISVEDTQKAYADQISKIRQEIFSAEAELAERQADGGRIDKIAGHKRRKQPMLSLATEVPAEQVDKYRRICALLTYLEGKEQNYLTQQGFTPENVLVKQVHEQIVQNEASKRNLEENYPGLVALNDSLIKPATGNHRTARRRWRLD